MAASAFDLFRIDIGPGSSHIVGHMGAARLFVHGLQKAGLTSAVALVYRGLCGSPGATGRGHGSDKAVLLGLCGLEPESAPIEAVAPTIAAIRQQGGTALVGVHVGGGGSRAKEVPQRRTHR